MRLDRSFFNRDTKLVGRELLGKIIVRKYNNVELRAKIVETESYIGYFDKACHTYNGRKTNRTQVMYGEAGHLYIYLNYGLYNLMNIVTNREGMGEAVLIRAVEPVLGIDEMVKNRFNLKKEDLNKYKRENITNGPGKLSMALNINMENNKEDICSSNLIYIEDNKLEKFNTISSKRIGIDYAEEAKDFLLRFYIEGNNYVSVK